MSTQKYADDTILSPIQGYRVHKTRTHPYLLPAASLSHPLPYLGNPSWLVWYQRWRPSQQRHSNPEANLDTHHDLTLISDVQCHA